ncbi:MAG: hypothetical protein AB1730_13530 [Myxococcota bacterium]|jgi:HPt (histidine-containing phosphotransfer) domain-containing protein
MESRRSHDTEAHDTDRALRDELERLQSHLRQVRTALANEQARELPAEAETRAALEAATARRDAARAALAALSAEAQKLERSCARLDEQLESKRAEDAVLALGASRRDEYVEWLKDPRKDRWYDLLLAVLMILLVGLGYWALGAL